ncbi:ribonuclease H family protein [Corallincola spongiicola]|uniref:ribonuclease H n=1 Tax=Corallincola spongiicola TaxID=2520508 RepID=A0ABY1WPE4_9GAMM|nr:ribonuclease H family protein [Corallincola spongiicola]TAA45822.1 ribonuclease HI [Corallincola spongiicola]
MAKKFYVVWAGKQPGIYTDWASCKAQVDQFPGARYKSFPTQAEAEAAYGGGTSSKPTGKAPAKKRSNGQTVKTYSAKEVDALKADIKIFTDGGCEPNPGKAGSGLAVYFCGEVAELWYGLYNPNGTNNTAELNALHQAMLMASKQLDRGRSVAIFCDSKYSIQCITQWAAGWEKKSWKKPSGEIKNLELIQTMFALYQTIKGDIKILHVNGHVGVEGNELADRMSIVAVDKKSKTFQRYTDPLDVPAILALRNG